jgi:hypothetical protein
MERQSSPGEGSLGLTGKNSLPKVAIDPPKQGVPRGMMNGMPPYAGKTRADGKANSRQKTQQNIHKKGVLRERPSKRDGKVQVFTVKRELR